MTTIRLVASVTEEILITLFLLLLLSSYWHIRETSLRAVLAAAALFSSLKGRVGVTGCKKKVFRVCAKMSVRCLSPMKGESGGMEERKLGRRRRSVSRKKTPVN